MEGWVDADDGSAVFKAVSCSLHAVRRGVPVELSGVPI
jgi:hypothetical protein